MAGTITLNVKGTIVNGSFKDSFNPSTLTIVQTNQGKGGGIQNIGTSEEVVSFGGVTTEGVIFLANLDTSNYVTWGPESGGVMIPMGRIKAGESYPWRVEPGVILRAKADTAAIELDVRLYED